MKPMGKWHIYRDMSKAGELTELLKGKLGFLRDLLKARGLTEKKPRGLLFHVSRNPGKDNATFITPADAKS